MNNSQNLKFCMFVAVTMFIMAAVVNVNVYGVPQQGGYFYSPGAYYSSPYYSHPGYMQPSGIAPLVPRYPQQAHTFGTWPSYYPGASYPYGQYPPYRYPNSGSDAPIIIIVRKRSLENSTDDHAPPRKPSGQEEASQGGGPTSVYGRPSRCTCDFMADCWCDDNNQCQCN